MKVGARFPTPAGPVAVMVTVAVPVPRLVVAMTKEAWVFPDVT